MKWFLWALIAFCVVGGLILIVRGAVAIYILYLIGDGIGLF